MNKEFGGIFNGAHFCRACGQPFNNRGDYIPTCSRKYIINDKPKSDPDW